MKSKLKLSRRDTNEPYLRSLRYRVEGWNDWGDGKWTPWFSISKRTKREALELARETLLGNDNRNVPTALEGFERVSC